MPAEYGHPSLYYLGLTYNSLDDKTTQLTLLLRHYTHPSMIHQEQRKGDIKLFSLSFQHSSQKIFRVMQIIRQWAAHASQKVTNVFRLWQHIVGTLFLFMKYKEDLDLCAVSLLWKSCLLQLSSICFDGIFHPLKCHNHTRNTFTLNT